MSEFCQTPGCGHEKVSHVRRFCGAIHPGPGPISDRFCWCTRYTAPTENASEDEDWVGNWVLPDSKMLTRTLEFDHWYTGPHIDPLAAVTEALSFVPDGWAATGNDMGKWESDTETFGYGTSATKKTTWRVRVTVWASEGEA